MKQYYLKITAVFIPLPFNKVAVLSVIKNYSRFIRFVELIKGLEKKGKNKTIFLLRPPCFRFVMPSTRRHSYDLNFKLKIVAEAEAVDNNREIAREYGISESMVRKWRNQQHVLFSGELKMTAKRASMGVFNSGHDSFFECLPHFVGAR